MPTVVSQLADFSQTDTGARPWSDPAAASAAGGDRAIVAVDPDPAQSATWQFSTERIIATGVVSKPPAHAKALTQVRVTVVRSGRHLTAGPYVDAIADLRVYLVKAGAPLETLDKARPEEWPGTDEPVVYTFDASDLELLGVDIASVRHEGFGACLSAFKTGTSDPIQPEIDHIALEYDFDAPAPRPEEEPMDFHHAGTQGGFVALHSEAMPDLSSSAKIFMNAPSATAMIEVTPLASDLVVRWGAGETAATPNTGNLYAAGGTYRFSVNHTQALLAQAIENAPTASGWITYWGIA